MIETVKLHMWDFFAYILSGATVSIVVLGHLICRGAISFNDIAKVPSAISVLIGSLLILIVGLLLEPIANLFFKLLRLSDKKESFAFTEWDNDIKKLEEEAVKYVPSNTFGTYNYCKNTVLLYCGAGQFDSFLGKYGFYRNMVLIFIANVIISFVIYTFSWSGNFWAMIISMTLACSSWYRSKVFYRHMSVAIYTQFILYNSEHKTNPKSP